MHEWTLGRWLHDLHEHHLPSVDTISDATAGSRVSKTKQIDFQSSPLGYISSGVIKLERRRDSTMSRCHLGRLTTSEWVDDEYHLSFARFAIP